MILEFDREIQGRAYPNLARHQAVPYTPEWRQFSQHWPFSEPVMLTEYCNEHGIDWRSQGPRFYVIAVSFFDFNIKWFDIMPPSRLAQLRNGDLGLLFFYSEGDNPAVMRAHLEAQCVANHVPVTALWIVSANSAADALPQSMWFADDELLFRKHNASVPAVEYHEQARSKQFTALVRTHKWWRATTMTEFWRRGWHKQGYFSYNPAVAVGEPEEENPIEVDRYAGLRDSTYEFLRLQFMADSLTSDQHNDHHLSVPEHYSDAYLNVVIETHMDVDQSGGVFLTEKTFKPIKNAQPFVIFGAAHSIARLRDLGYRTFDHVIDHSYDHIENTTDRWQRIFEVLTDLFASDMHNVYCACKQDLLYNQQHFLGHKKDRLNTLLGKLKCK
jgi:hypothetical protein